MIAKLLTPWFVKGSLVVMVGMLAWIGVREIQLSMAFNKLETATTKLTGVERERDQFRDNVAEANRQHDTTRESLRKVKAALRTAQKESLRIANENAAAVAKANLARSDAERTLKQITDDFADAMRDPACKICGNQPICPALLGGKKS